MSEKPIDWEAVAEAARDGFGYCETSKREAQRDRVVGALIGALTELAAQAEGAPAPRRSPAAGDTVRITSEEGARDVLHGREGTVIEDDGTDTYPFRVMVKGVSTGWYCADELEIVS